MQQKGTCFRRCLSLVEMRGIDSRRELRASVGRGHDSPPDCRSVPLLLRSPSSLFAKNKQKKKHLLFCKYFSLSKECLFNKIEVIGKFRNARQATPRNRLSKSLLPYYLLFLFSLQFFYNAEYRQPYAADGKRQQQTYHYLCIVAQYVAPEAFIYLSVRGLGGPGLNH